MGLENACDHSITHTQTRRRHVSRERCVSCERHRRRETAAAAAAAPTRSLDNMQTEGSHDHTCQERTLAHWPATSSTGFHVGVHD